MSLKLRILFNLFILFLSLEVLETKAHNTLNGGCKNHCSSISNQRGHGNKIKIFKENEKLIKEKNSCLNNSLCRG